MHVILIYNLYIEKDVMRWVVIKSSFIDRFVVIEYYFFKQKTSLHATDASKISQNIDIDFVNDCRVLQKTTNKLLHQVYVKNMLNKHFNFGFIMKYSQKKINSVLGVPKRFACLRVFFLYFHDCYISRKLNRYFIRVLANVSPYQM